MLLIVKTPPFAFFHNIYTDVIRFADVVRHGIGFKFHRTFAECDGFSFFQYLERGPPRPFVVILEINYVRGNIIGMVIQKCEQIKLGRFNRFAASHPKQIIKLPVTVEISS